MLIKLIVFINDIIGIFIVFVYIDIKMKIGCIFGIGCNVVYMEDCGFIFKFVYFNFLFDIFMVINCEWGVFDNEFKVFFWIFYDEFIDMDLFCFG